MKSNNTEIKYTILFSILTLACLCAASFFVGDYKCQVRSASFEDSRYDLIAGCMVKRNNRWIPLENIRGFGDSE